MKRETYEWFQRVFMRTRQKAGEKGQRGESPSSEVERKMVDEREGGPPGEETSQCRKEREAMKGEGGSRCQMLEVRTMQTLNIVL